MAVARVPSGLHRLTAGEYRRLVDAGVFDEDARVELIDGLIVDMSPKTPAHENVVAWLLQRLMTSVDLERYEVRASAPLTLAGSEPEPDLAVIERLAPRPSHPATAALVIEVAVSSQMRDLHEKPLLYARAGVPRYWVVDLDAARAVEHTHPRAAGYASAGAVDLLDAPELGLPPIPVADLLVARG